jgi:hypothetical protein
VVAVDGPAEEVEEEEVAAGLVKVAVAGRASGKSFYL